MKKRTVKKRKLHKECWNLNSEFLKWLRERLPVYLHDAERIVDLESISFNYHNKNFTQKELVKRMIQNLESIQNDDDTDNPLVKETLEIWTLVFPAMWW